MHKTLLQPLMDVDSEADFPSHHIRPQLHKQQHMKHSKQIRNSQSHTWTIAQTTMSLAHENEAKMVK